MDTISQNDPNVAPNDNTDQATRALNQLGLTNAEQVLNLIQSLQQQVNETTTSRNVEQSIPVIPSVVPTSTTAPMPTATPTTTIPTAPPTAHSDLMEDVQPTQSLLLPSVRLAVPKHFSKQMTPGELNMWILEIRSYIQSGTVRGTLLTEEEKITLAASYLSGEARLNWGVANQVSALYSNDDPRKINTLEKFFQHLIDTNTDWNEEERIRKKYMQLKQRRSAGEYGRELILLANLLHPRPTEHEILERFKFGLQERIRRELVHILDPPETLEGFIKLCVRIDRQLYEYRISQSNSNDHSFNMMSQTTGESSTQHRQPTKGTPEWNKWCHKENRCLECGKTGHKKFECRSKGSGTSRPNQSTTSRLNMSRLNTNRPNTNTPPSVTFDVSKTHTKDKAKGMGRL